MQALRGKKPELPGGRGLRHPPPPPGYQDFLRPSSTSLRASGPSRAARRPELDTFTASAMAWERLSLGGLRHHAKILLYEKCNWTEYEECGGRTTIPGRLQRQSLRPQRQDSEPGRRMGRGELDGESDRALRGSQIAPCRSRAKTGTLKRIHANERLLQQARNLESKAELTGPDRLDSSRRTFWRCTG